jgi:hypothetical protein
VVFGDWFFVIGLFGGFLRSAPDTSSARVLAKELIAHKLYFVRVWGTIAYGMSDKDKRFTKISNPRK